MPRLRYRLYLSHIYTSYILHTQRPFDVQFCFSFPTFFLANSIYLSVQSAGLNVVVVLVAVLDQAERKALSLSPYLSPSIGIGRIGEGVGSSGRSGERKRGAIIGSASTYLLSDLADFRGGLCGPIGVYLCMFALFCCV